MTDLEDHGDASLLRLAPSDTIASKATTETSRQLSCEWRAGKVKAGTQSLSKIPPEPSTEPLPRRASRPARATARYPGFECSGIPGNGGGTAGFVPVRLIVGGFFYWREKLQSKRQ